MGPFSRVGNDARSSPTRKVLGGMFQAALGTSEDQISGWETEQPGGQGVWSAVDTEEAWVEPPDGGAGGVSCRPVAPAR